MSTEKTQNPTPDWQGYSGGRTWIQSDRPMARAIARPVRDFLHVETAGGIVLLIATVAALILANTPWGDTIADFWHTELVLIEIGDFRLAEDLGHWVNDGLMAIFFFVVGLEIKRELVDGELSNPRQATLPAIAAVGGMVVPAAIYFFMNVGTDYAHGWGIPMATDIAFAVGVMALLGSRVPSPLKVFLLTLAIVDDIGAILVIAIFYTESINLGWLATGGVLLAIIVGLRIIRVWYMPIYVILGIGVWVAFLESGVHATIAGVILGLLTPAKPLRPSATKIEIEPRNSWDTIRSTIFDAKETLSVAERLQHSIHPWSAFVILPIFAFANAGIKLSGEALSNAASSSVALGVIAGLVLGKPIGVFVFAWLTKTLGLGDLPAQSGWGHIIGVGALSGIGFTVSLFVTGLAFDGPEVTDVAKIGVLTASVLAAAIGAFILSRPHKAEGATAEA